MQDLIQNLPNVPVVLGLMLANLAASIYAFNNARFMDQNLFYVGPILNGGQYHRMITSGFLHANFTHLGMNMIGLLSFGTALEMTMGPVKFFILYMASLIGGNLWALMENRRNLQYRAYGASGGVSGLLIAFALFAPFAKMGIILVPIEFPAAVFAAVFIGLSAWLQTRPNKIIGHEAHLGGALIGGLTAVLLVPGLWANFIRQLSGLA